MCIDENENTFNIPLSSLPEVNERDVLEACFVTRPDLRKKKEADIKNIIDKLNKYPPA